MAKRKAETAAAAEEAAEPTFEPRRADKAVGSTISYTAADGTQKTLKADGGVFRPESSEEVAVLDSFGLAGARADQDGGKE
jgi:hypothetical protein